MKTRKIPAGCKTIDEVISEKLKNAEFKKTGAQQTPNLPSGVL